MMHATYKAAMDEVLELAVQRCARLFVGQITSGTTEWAADSVVKALVNDAVCMGHLPAGYLLTGFFINEDNPTVAEIHACPNYADFPASEKEYEDLVGRPPIQDDLHRLNCGQVGEFGHFGCGWCLKHTRLRSECGCLVRKKEA
jgi:hypothetical protein